MAEVAFSAGGVTVPTLSAPFPNPDNDNDLAGVAQYTISGSGTVAARFRLFASQQTGVPYAQVGDDVVLLGDDGGASALVAFPFHQTNAAWSLQIQVVSIVGSGATAKAFFAGS